VQKLRIATLTIAIVGLLAGCSSGNSAQDAFSGITPVCDHYVGGSAIDAVQITTQSTGAPTVDFANASSSVSFASALSKITKPETKLVSEGSGPAFTGNELLSVDYAVYSSSTGKLVGSNAFNGTDSQPIFVDTKTYAVFCNALSGVKEGSVAAVAVPANASNPEGALYIFKINKVNLPHANGDVQSPVSGLPQVVRDPKTGEPGLVPTSISAPKEFKRAVVIEGKGEVVKATDTVTVNYKLWDWTTSLGGSLESSWDSQPATLNLASGTIKGFSMALDGVKVGSQVITSIPAEFAYGASGTGSIQPNATLLFVIDVLGKGK